MDIWEKNEIIGKVAIWLKVRENGDDSNLNDEEKAIKLEKAVDLFQTVTSEVKRTVASVIDAHDYGNIIFKDSYKNQIENIVNNSNDTILHNQIYDFNKKLSLVVGPFKSPYGVGLYQSENMACTAFIALPSNKEQTYQGYSTERRYKSECIRERSYFNRSDSIMTIIDQTGFTLTLEPEANTPYMPDHYEYWTGNDNKVQDALIDLYNEHRVYSNGRLVIRDEFIMTPEYALKLINQATGGMLDGKDWLNNILGKLLVKHPYYNSTTKMFAPFHGYHNGNTNARAEKVIVVMETTVSPNVSAMDEQYCSPPATGVMVVYGDYDKSVNVKRSLASLGQGAKYLMTSKFIKNSSWLTVVDKAHRPYTLYYKVGNVVKSIESIQQTTEEDGIYIFEAIADDLTTSSIDPRLTSSKSGVVKGPHSDSIINVTLIPLEEASKHGFFMNETDVEINGNLDNAIALKSQQNKLELLDKEKIVKDTDYTSTQVKYELDKQALIRKEEFETRQHNFNMEKLMNDLIHKNEINELEREKHAVKYYYEAKSLDRKDTSEGLKIIPGIITGLASVGAALLTVSMVSKASTASIAGATLATSLAMLTVPVPLVIGLSIVGGVTVFKGLAKFVSNNKDSFSQIGSAVKDVVVRAGQAVYGAGKTLVTCAWNGVKYVGGAVWSGAKAVGSATWSGVKAVGRGISNVGSWMSSWW